MVASLDQAGQSIPVILRNLSAQGAQVDGDFSLTVGDAVTLQKGELSVPGRIAWRDGRKAGIAFACDLDPAVVLRHIPTPRPQLPHCHKRPGFRSACTA